MILLSDLSFCMVSFILTEGQVRTCTFSLHHGHARVEYLKSI